MSRVQKHEPASGRAAEQRREKPRSQKPRTADKPKADKSHVPQPDTGKARPVRTGNGKPQAEKPRISRPDAGKARAGAAKTPKDQVKERLAKQKVQPQNALAAAFAKAMAKK